MQEIQALLVGLDADKEAPSTEEGSARTVESTGQLASEHTVSRIINFRVTFKGQLHDIEISDGALVRDIKVRCHRWPHRLCAACGGLRLVSTCKDVNWQETLERSTGIPAHLQKLLFKGTLGKNQGTIDNTLVRDLGLTDGQKIMLVGCTTDELGSVSTARVPMVGRNGPIEEVD